MLQQRLPQIQPPLLSTSPFIQTYHLLLFMNMFLSFSFITSCAQTSLPTSNQNLEINLYKQNMHTVILVCIRKLVVDCSLNFNLAVDIKYVIFQHFSFLSVYPHLSTPSAHWPCQDHHILALLLWENTRNSWSKTATAGLRPVFGRNFRISWEQKKD